MTHILDSHKGWKGKFIRLKSTGGFELPLKWELVDWSSNMFFEEIEAEQDLFNKVWAMSFFKEVGERPNEGEKVLASTSDCCSDRGRLFHRSFCSNRGA